MEFSSRSSEDQDDDHDNDQLGDMKSFTTTATVDKCSVGHSWTIPIMHRVSWGGMKLPKAALRIMHSPVTHIRLTDTGTQGCNETQECARIVREFQQNFMNAGFPDQPYNFLIGGEGTVFVGRGWFRRAMLAPANTTFNETCVEIAYIGSYQATGPPDDMLFTALDLIKYGVKNNNVHPFFKILEYKPMSLP